MTPEEKKAKAAETKARKEAEFQAAITGPRAGWNPNPKPQAAPVPVNALKGIELGDVEQRPVAWFRPDPDNAEFEALKERQPGYWQNLRRDIEAAGILTPLVALPDGLLLQGHSRLKVAQDIGLARVPVRLVLSDLTPEEVRRRRRLDNLLRFEVDEDTRLAMLAEVWPAFYTKPGEKGRPQKTDHGDTITTAATIAEATGKSVPQVKRDRALVTNAAEIAKQAGKATPTPADIKAAREQENAKRREEAKRKPESGPALDTGTTPPPGPPQVKPENRPPLEGEAPSPGWLAMKAWAHKLETLLDEMVAAEVIQPEQQKEIFRIVRGY